MGVNDKNRGYSDQTARKRRPREPRPRGRQLSEAYTVASRKAPPRNARERQLSGVNHGKPEHKGFSKADQKRLKDAAKADAQRQGESK